MKDNKVLTGDEFIKMCLDNFLYVSVDGIFCKMYVDNFSVMLVPYGGGGFHFSFDLEKFKSCTFTVDGIFISSDNLYELFKVKQFILCKVFTP